MGRTGYILIGLFITCLLFGNTSRSATVIGQAKFTNFSTGVMSSIGALETAYGGLTTGKTDNVYYADSDNAEGTVSNAGRPLFKSSLSGNYSQIAILPLAIEFITNNGFFDFMGKWKLNGTAAYGWLKSDSSGNVQWSTEPKTIAAFNSYSTATQTKLDGKLSTSGTASAASAIAMVTDNSLGSTVYPVWVTSGSSNQNPYVSTGGKLSFVPSTGMLTATGFTGSLTGNSTGLSAQYIDWNSGSGGNSIANKPTIPTAASTVTGETTYGASSNAGSASTFSKGDHTHGTPATTKDTTAVTGILYGNGTSVAAAVAGNFPTLNQSTTGTSAGLTGTPNITVGTISASDLTQSGKRISGVQTHSATHTSTSNITITGKIIEVTTDDDGDTDYLYLPAGTAGQELEIVIKSMGSTSTGLGVYATFSDGTTNFTFPAGSTGRGINLVYSGNATTGWVISSANVAAASGQTPGTNGTGAVGSSVTWARSDHTHPNGVGNGTLYSVSADQALSSTTATNITGLSWTEAASTTYNFYCQIIVTNGATSLLRLGLNGAASPTAWNVNYKFNTTAISTDVSIGAAAPTATATIAAVTASVLTTGTVYRIQGSVVNGTTAGTLQFHGTASTNAITSTVRKGSYCLVF